MPHASHFVSVIDAVYSRTLPFYCFGRAGDGRRGVDLELAYDLTLQIRSQFWRARTTTNGTCLLVFLEQGHAAEYNKNFKKIWKYKSTNPWSALRLKDDNALITDKSHETTRKVNARGETVWEFNCKTDMPVEYLFASAPQSCTRLSNRNFVFTPRGKNCQGPQLVEVTSNNKIVWVLQDWKEIGDGTAVQILDDPGIPEAPGQSAH